jgi:aminopeptidase N
MEPGASPRLRIATTTVLLLFATAMSAATPEGIPRALARERASLVSDLRYRLGFTLAPGAPSVPGRARLTFRMAKQAPLLLDYREGKLLSVSVNGANLPPQIVNGHIEIPAKVLRAGENNVLAAFESPIAPAGRAFIRYLDRDDNTEYVYTLFVPMDASMAFPCFDQPDIKGRFTLSVSAPKAWTVIANGLPAGSPREFRETEPISTYLFAFAAGPFRKLGPALGLSTLWVRQSKLSRAQQEAGAVLDLTDRGTTFLSQYFARPFPFPKYDMVLLPGFAFGGMEHAGATFLREESILFRTEPTASDQAARSRLLLHELVHQWFGDLVTMRWFDDLWLKEGFANYMAYLAMDEVQPGGHTWKRFFETIRPAAYGIDATPGTTPIYQQIGNLKDAKSAYGAIVYSKAPALLRQLSFVLGANSFRDGLRLYLREHAFGNAEFAELISAFERASGRKLQGFTESWIRRRGMPRVTVDWACDGNRISRLSLSQKDMLGEGGPWPLETQVGIYYPGKPAVPLRVSLSGASSPVADAVGKPCPAWVFANDEDYGYGLFLLDARSREAVERDLGTIADPFLRSMLWGALWDSVREAQMPPGRYLDLACRLLPKETDEAILQTTLPRAVTAMHRYLPERGDWPGRFESLAAEGVRTDGTLDGRIAWFRGLRAVAETPAGLERVAGLLDGKLTVPGLPLRPLDRWNLVTTLVAMRHPEASVRLAAERKRDPSGEGLKYAWIADAATPDPAVKRRYFDDYLTNQSLQEDWVEQSLGAFNWWSQADLTRPYLARALEALPQVKRERRIFFVLAWLNAFIGGQHDDAALEIVRAYLASGKAEPDLRLKVLEVTDELERAVRIRAAAK